MNTLIITVAMLASAASPPYKAADTSDVKPPQLKRIGQVFVLGNEFTRQDVILRVVDLRPGQILYYSDLAVAQKRVAGLGIFKPGSVSVTVEGDPNNPDSEYKNVFIYVEEMCTGSLTLMPSVGCGGKPVLDLVWEERNFDPLRFPASLDDLMSGEAFRGGGQMFRLVLLRIPVVP